ncbi:zeta toxin family protein [Bdellovibrio sp. HCB185ZH]|uniref:zeta toxin family protein n=1 Tax=Bdellovibrio sp. HCB185ZH TaxID=3394235 RepID=UPI0039A59482
MRLKKEKTLVVLAGPNGSGKSTYRLLETSLHDLPFVNADDIAKTYGTVGEIESLKAQQEAQNQIADYLSRGESFCFETVFSHESKVQLIENAKELGYIVLLYIINPGNSNLNIIRVKERVKKGGHDVPVDKILSRISRTLQNLKKALPLVDGFFIINSSGASGTRFLIEASKAPQQEVKTHNDLSDWAKDLLAVIQQADVPEVNKPTLQLVQSTPDACAKCGAPLRGKKRKKFGICSKCAPRY